MTNAPYLLEDGRVSIPLDEYNSLRDEIEEQQKHIDALQAKVHLCAAYDWLEAENEALTHDIERHVAMTASQADEIEKLRNALHQYANRDQWEKFVPDGYRGEIDAFDWDGDLADEPWEFAERALQTKISCPKCGGPTTHDREYPPNPYVCERCETGKNTTEHGAREDSPRQVSASRSLETPDGAPPEQPPGQNTLQKGDYVLATKYADGDPGDQWAVGWYDRNSPNGIEDRHMVVDETGKQFRHNGFRRCEKITHEQGVWIADHLSDIEASIRDFYYDDDGTQHGRGLWDWLKEAGTEKDTR